MNCPNCNSPLPEGGFFCPECGTRIPQAAAAVVTAAIAEEAPAVQPVPVAQPESPVYTEPEPPVYTEPQPPVYAEPQPPVYAEPAAQPVPVYAPPAVEEPVKPKKEKKVKEKKVKEPKASSGKKTGTVILTVLLVILLLAAAALNVLQYLRYDRDTTALNETIAANEKTIAANTATISQQEQVIASNQSTIEELTEELVNGSTAAEEMTSTITDLENSITDLNSQLETAQQELVDKQSVIDDQWLQLASMSVNSENYLNIIEYLAGQNIGYAAENFCSSDCIIVMSMAEGTRQFFLTAHWPDGGTVGVEMGGYAVDLAFDSNSWDEGTTMTITALEPGVSVFHFYNDVDYNTFRMLVIVTE